jgi:hypothetical protein
MAYNPITGEYESGGESYDAQRIKTGVAMTGMDAIGADIPLAFRIMENIPGITAMSMLNARRYSNTMFRGGFLDVGPDASARQIRRAQKFGATVGGVPQSPNQKGFLFGRRRFADGLPGGKTPLFKPSRINNFTLRPRIFNRFSSVTALSGVANQGFYTPFQGGSFLESMFGKRARERAIAAGNLPEGSQQRMFSGGVLGRMSTMTNAYNLENKQARLIARGVGEDSRSMRRVTGKLSKLDDNLLIVSRQGMTAPYAANYNQVAQELLEKQRIASGFRYPGGEFRKLNMTDEALRSVDKLTTTQISGNRLRAISDSSAGLISRRMTEYMGTMLDPSKFVGTKAYAALHQNISKVAIGQTASSGTINMAATSTNVTNFLAGQSGTIDDIGKYGVRSLSNLSRMALSSGQKGVAARLAGAAGVRALGLSMPGLNVIGTAAVVYDLTKLAATGVVAAGNFAKDAVKSMQGSIRKPVFGMGYQDNEVAATSRARGVMAIQNSRLNARSTLGSEASMMASHFG